jgi:ADP-ribose pyrophosphatase
VGEFRRVEERIVHAGSLIEVAEATFEAPDGTHFERDVVHHPGAVSVVPILEDGSVLLVRQYRAAIDGDLLEIPAGKRDVAGEPPEVTAHRELEEEVGMRAGRLELLARFYNSPGFCDEHSHVFVATDLTPTDRRAHGVEEQYLTVHRVPLDEVHGMIADGTIVDAKTIIGLSLARLRREGLS